MMNGIGADEVIVETPRHDRSLHELDVNEVADVIRDTGCPHCRSGAG